MARPAYIAAAISHTVGTIPAGGALPPTISPLMSFPAALHVPIHQE